MMALYRIVEPSGGRIVIDGCDTSKIGLTDLRSRLALVPQVSDVLHYIRSFSRIFLSYL